MTIGSISSLPTVARRASETPAPITPVSDERAKSMSFSSSAGPQRRSSVVPDGVTAESPQIVHAGDGEPRAAAVGDTAANESVASLGGLADGEATVTPRKKGHSRAHSFFHGVKWPFSGSNTRAERKPSDLKAPVAASEPATLEILVKAQEFEEMPLENRPPREAEQPMKQRKGGLLPNCIKPRTAED